MKTPGARLRRLVVGCEAPHPTRTDVVDSRQNTLPGLCSSTTACGARLLGAFCLCMACGAETPAEHRAGLVGCVADCCWWGLL